MLASTRQIVDRHCVVRYIVAIGIVAMRAVVKQNVARVIVALSNRFKCI